MEQGEAGGRRIVHKREVTVSEELEVCDIEGTKQYVLVGVLHQQPGHWLAVVRGRDGQGRYACSDREVKATIQPRQMVCSLVMYVKRDCVSFHDLGVQMIYKQVERTETVYNLRPNER